MNYLPFFGVHGVASLGCQVVTELARHDLPGLWKTNAPYTGNPRMGWHEVDCRSETTNFNEIWPPRDSPHWDDDHFATHFPGGSNGWASWQRWRRVAQYAPKQVLVCLIGEMGSDCGGIMALAYHAHMIGTKVVALVVLREGANKSGIDQEGILVSLAGFADQVHTIDGATSDQATLVRDMANRTRMILKSLFVHHENEPDNIVEGNP